MSTIEYLKYRDSLLKRLLNTTDINILRKVEEAFNNSEEDFFNELSEDDKKEFLAALKESEKGLGRPFREVLADL